MSGALVLAVLVLSLAEPALVASAAEQTVEPIVPQAEQRVDDVSSPATERIEALDAPGTQAVEASESSGPVGHAASAVGKAALGVLALGVSLGFTVASLLFF